MKLFQCFHIQKVVVPFLRNNPSAVVFSAIYIFCQKIPGKIFGAHLGFSLHGIPLVKNTGLSFLHFRLIASTESSTATWACALNTQSSL